MARVFVLWERAILLFEREMKILTVINMLSKADTVKGQGVLSAYEEQVKLVRDGLPSSFEVVENSRRQSDILHIHTVNPTFYLRSQIRKKSSVSVGYVHFLPETLEESLRLPPLAKMLFYRYLIRFYKSCDQLVVVNPCFIKKLESYGISPEKVTYIPNFVSEEGFYPLPDKKALRRKRGLEEERFTVLSVGQLQLRKGVLDLAALARRMPEVQFVWAGDFSFGKLSAGYQEILELQKNPPENLTFLGMIDRGEMNEVYNLADVLFQPSYDELFPMTVLEAMCCGLPLVLRNLPLYKAILEGCYISAGDGAGFEAALRRLMEEPFFYEEAARRSVKGHAFYNKEHVLRLWESFYASMRQRAADKAWRGRLPERRLPVSLK